MTRSDCRTALWKQARWNSSSCDAAVDFETVVGTERCRSEANVHLRQVAHEGRVERSRYKCSLTVPVYLVYSCAGTNDNMTKFCTSSLLCDAVLRLSLLLLGLVGIGPKNLAPLKGQRLESYSAEGSTVGNAPCHTPK